MTHIIYPDKRDIAPENMRYDIISAN